MGIILKEVAPTGDYIPDAFRRMYGRPFVYFQNLNTLFLGEPGMHHDDVLKSAGRPGYSGTVAYGDMGKNGIEWYRADEGVPKSEIAALLGHPDKPASTDPAWHFANGPMNVVKIDHSPGDHGSGRPIIYHPHSNTAYVGVPGGYHESLQDQMERVGIKVAPQEHWRLGPDGLLDFYDFGGLTPATTPQQRQEAVRALGAKGVHDYDGDKDWYFARVGGFADTHPQDYDLPHQPEAPQTPEDYWKAVTINGQHHVFPGDSKSHLQMVQDLGHTAHDVSDYWGWNPYMKKWESFNRFQQDYRDIQDSNPNNDPWDFNGPTVSKVAWETNRGMRKRIVNDNLNTFTKMYTKDLDKAYANGVAPRADWPASMNRVTRQYGGPGWSDADDSQFHQNYQQQKQQEFQTNPDIYSHEYENWVNWYAQHFPQHFDPEGTAIHAEPWTLSHTGASPVPKYIPPHDDDIRSLLTSEIVPGRSDKGLELPDGTHYYWHTDGFGWPHHQEVIQAMGLTKQNPRFIDLSDPGEAWDFE